MRKPNWQGNIWLMNNKEEYFYCYNSETNEEFAIKLPFGGLFTMMFHIEKFKELLSECGNPKILDIEGRSISEEKIVGFLNKEKEIISYYTDNLLFNNVSYPQNKKNALNRHLLLDSPRELSLWKDYADKRVQNVHMQFASPAEQRVQNIDIKFASFFKIPQVSSRVKDKCEIKYIDEPKGFSVFKYTSEDVLALMWLEILKAFEQGISANKCEECGSYYFHALRKDRKVCYLCKPPSLKPFKGRPEEELEKYRIRWRIRKRYEKGVMTLNEANAELTKHGLKEIKPRVS